MKRIMQFAVAAILVACGASTLASCSGYGDNPVDSPDEPQPSETIVITEDDITDGEYYYKLYVSDNPVDYASARGADGTDYGSNAAEWTVCVPVDYHAGYASKLCLEQVSAVPAGTPVLIRAKKPQAYEVRAASPAAVVAPAVNMLAVAAEDLTLDGKTLCGAVLVKNARGVYFRARAFGTVDVAAGDIYLSLTRPRFLTLAFCDFVRHPTPVMAFPGEEPGTVDTPDILTLMSLPGGKALLTLKNARVTYVTDEYDDSYDAHSGIVMVEDESRATCIPYSMQDYPGLGSKVAPGDVLNGTLEMEAVVVSDMLYMVPTQKAIEQFSATVTRTAGPNEPTLIYPGFGNQQFLATPDGRYVRINGVTPTRGTGDDEKLWFIDLSDIIPGCVPYLEDGLYQFSGRTLPLEEGVKTDLTGFINLYPDGHYTFQPVTITPTLQSIH